jgi:hypothetical protein
MLKIAENMVFKLTAYLDPIKENQLSNLPLLEDFFHCLQSWGIFIEILHAV